MEKQRAERLQKRLDSFHARFLSIVMADDMAGALETERDWLKKEHREVIIELGELISQAFTEGYKDALWSDPPIDVHVIPSCILSAWDDSDSKEQLEKFLNAPDS